MDLVCISLMPWDSECLCAHDFCISLVNDWSLQIFAHFLKIGFLIFLLLSFECFYTFCFKNMFY